MSALLIKSNDKSLVIAVRVRPDVNGNKVAVCQFAEDGADPVWQDEVWNDENVSLYQLRPNKLASLYFSLYGEAEHRSSLQELPVQSLADVAPGVLTVDAGNTSEVTIKQICDCSGVTKECGINDEPDCNDETICQTVSLN